jgi:hypothetical protein
MFTLQFLVLSQQLLSFPSFWRPTFLAKFNLTPGFEALAPSFCRCVTWGSRKRINLHNVNSCWVREGEQLQQTVGTSLMDSENWSYWSPRILQMPCDGWHQVRWMLGINGNARMCWFQDPYELSAKPTSFNWVRKTKQTRVIQNENTLLSGSINTMPCGPFRTIPGNTRNNGNNHRVLFTGAQHCPTDLCTSNPPLRMEGKSVMLKIELKPRPWRPIFPFSIA